MKLFQKVLLGLVLALVVVAGAVGGRWFADNRKPNFKSDIEIYVTPGMTVKDVMAEIPDGSVMRPASLRRVMKKELTDEDIKPGHYTLGRDKPSIYAARMIRFGWQTPVNLVLAGTMRQKGQIARKISSQLLLDSTEVYNALGDSTLLSSYGFTPQNVFSLIIPDTYQMYWTASMKDVLDRQKEAYDAFWTESNLEEAEARHLTPLEGSIVASSVKCESNFEPEYSKIAGVYLNRLRQGMRLQADPTVAYCYGFSLNRILYKHLEVDSPYNTYRNYGLPPGPICVPDKASLYAVLNPDGHNYLYFCASPDMDGTHRFASSLNEHSRNAQAFQRALNARNASK